MNLKVTEVLQKTKKTIFCYPLVLLMSLIMTISVIYLIEGNSSSDKYTLFFAAKIALVSSIGISLLFGLKMFAQRNGKEPIWNGIGILFLVGFYYILPQKEVDFTEMYAYLLIPVYLLSHLLVAVVPFLKKENSENHFWQYNKNLFVNTFLTIVFTGVLTGGIELAILAVSNLFNIHISGDIYSNTFFFLLIFGSSFIFLLFNEGGLNSLEKEEEYPIVLKFFTQFILIPLLLTYAVILYFYSAKIVTNWELPKGWVSYLVLAYSMVGILALLLVHPLKGDTSKSWVLIFSKVFYYSLIPLLLLLFVAIFTRVLEYGYTEARYFVLLLAIWLTSVVSYFVFFKKSTIKFIPISLFLIGLFALVFPYLNAFSVAKRSQKSQLEQILNENNLLVNGKIDFNKEVDEFVVYEIESKFTFLDNRLERDYLKTFLDTAYQKALPTDKYWYLGNQFKQIKKTNADKISQTRYIQLKSSQFYYDIADYQFAIYKEYLLDNSIKINEDRFKLDYDSYRLLQLTLNEKDTVDLIPSVTALFEKYKGLSTEVTVPNIFVECDLGSYHIKVVFNTIEQTSNPGETPSYWFDNALFLIKKK